MAMSLQLLKKLVAVHRYPRYVYGFWLRHTVRQQQKAIQAQVTQPGICAASSVVFYGVPIISVVQGSSIEIGERCVVCSDSRMTDLGVNHPVVMRTLRPGASIKIGKDTGISGGAICAAVQVKIGNECLIGANVIISDTDFHPINPLGRRYNENPLEIGAASVEIEDNVFVGTGAIILKGIKVGKNSVIGAGSVVTKNVPPDSIVAGNPARVLRKIQMP